MTSVGECLLEPLPADPMAVAAVWLEEAWERRVQPNPDAMVLATVDAQARPSARVVLCKEIVADPGYALFYTNYASRKGREIAEHPRAAAVMHWDLLQRQLRIEGPVLKSPPEESDAYFATRPWQRRVGAWASEQSQPVESRAALLAAVAATAARFGAPELNADATEDAERGVSVPRPPHWGGYRLWAESIELWVQGKYRIHDRARWTRTLRRVDEHSFASGAWTVTRLQP
jgi:pyridoxamine 5'-phosphate oxidase